VAKGSTYPALSSVAANTRYLAVHTANSVTNTYIVNTAVLFATNAAAKLLNHRTDTPANSTGTTCAPGEVWSDGNYVYFATANNVCKRVELTSF
jgi:hypothetical protein